MTPSPLLVAIVVLLVCWCKTSQARSAHDLLFVDTSFDCPVTTTCPVVCVKQAADCPAAAVCTEPGTTVCADGFCRSNCADSSSDSPCPSCLPVACPRITTDYDTCLTDFAFFYQQEEECRLSLEEGQTFNARPFGLAGVWVFVLTILTLAWSWRNGKELVLVPLESGTAKKKETLSTSSQAGVARVWTGRVIYYLVWITLVGFQVLILGFCVASYRANQAESLRAFEITWSLAFVWTLLLKWPHSLESLFFRAAPLDQATHVCVVVPPSRNAKQNIHIHRRRQKETHQSSVSLFLTFLRRTIACLSSTLQRSMACLFGQPASMGNGSKVHYCLVRVDPLHGTRYFVFGLKRYNYNTTEARFLPGTVTVVETLQDVVDGRPGLTSDQAAERLQWVGPNSIPMTKPTVMNSLIQEFSKAFYVYQCFMLWTWVPLNYYYMAIIHASVIVTGGLTVTWFQYRNESNLYKLTRVDGTVEVLRDGLWQELPQIQLVPGDVVIVRPGFVFTDLVLVQSQGVVVDESALTGESTPMAKTAVDPADASASFDPIKHKRHWISAGTTVLESEVENNCAMVVSTGSSTSKGKLLREVFAYERHQFKFDTEVGLVIFLLFLQAVVGFWIVVFLIGYDPVYAWFYGMYVVSALLPPLLPTVFTVSVGISDNRLTRKRIACSNSEDILVTGKVTKAFFDKTGTLTRQGLDYVSARCQNTWNQQQAGEGFSQDFSQDVVLGMSCCHGLTRSAAGEIIGNPVDRVMFEASQATFIEETGQSRTILTYMGDSVHIVKHFDFDHTRMTQSVVVRQSDGSFVAFVKGSSESIKELCSSASLPSDYDAAVRSSAKEGSYQISMAMKKLEDISENELQALSRDDVEGALLFVGVINFKNVMREETPDVIHQLEAAEVQCVMITGDSVLTGIHIAKECGMLKPQSQIYVCQELDENGERVWKDESDNAVTLPSSELLRSGNSGVELCVSGEVWDAWKESDPVSAADAAHAIRVYGRCTPFSKVSVVSTFVDMGYITMMCGDGGNDCGALKTAHVGVALSDAEASIVSPFTSLDKEITSVLDILQEGRCALASALASYKFVLMYGQIEALVNIMNAYFRINFTEYCWVFMDGFWEIGLSFTLPLSHAAKKLPNTRPTSSLLSAHTVSSVVGILVCNTAFTIIALVTLFAQDWFQCRKWENRDVSNLLTIGDNYEAETLFLIVGFQYISTGFAYSFGYEFRAAWYRNRWLVLLLALFTALHVWITLVPGRLSCVFRVNCSYEDAVYSVAAGEYMEIQNPFHTTLMPMSFRVVLLVLMALNTAANVGWDYGVVNGLRRRWAAQKREHNLQLGTEKTDLSSMV